MKKRSFTLTDEQGYEVKVTVTSLASSGRLHAPEVTQALRKLHKAGDDRLSPPLDQRSMDDTKPR